MGQSLCVKLVLLGGLMGWLSVTGLSTDLYQATEERHRHSRQERLSVQAARVVPVDLNHGSLGELQTSPGIQQGRQERPSVQAARVVPVDLNHGSLEELQTLPGIGPVLAERIVQYRREHGSFVSMAEVKQVRGIGAKRFEQLRPYVRVGQSEEASNNG